MSLAALLIAVSCVAAAPQEQASERTGEQVQTIRRMLMELHENDEFTGSVLVARGGAVIYRDAIAATPDRASGLLTSPANIASLAKGFTAMAVMMLAEQGKLSYDDPIDRHVPELARAAPAITIRHLLTHTSGIPDVGDLGIDRPGIDERDVVNAVRTHRAGFAPPGLKYRYSNTGYMILAMAVENVSGEPFDDFLQRAIFKPLGMDNTRADSGARGPLETKGDGGIVSTVDDLLKWDRALAGERLVRADTFAEALVPARVAEGTTSYGFGWNVARRDGQMYMWHTGNSGGRRAFLARYPDERFAIIILTVGNSRRVEIADAIVDILHGRPFERPKVSIARKLLAAIEEQGVDSALALYEQLRKTAERQYDFSEGELNGLGYALLDRGRNADAIRIFEFNVRQFPTSSNAFDSLGEACYRSGRHIGALKAYTRAVELDPGNANARTMLQKLK